MRFIVLGCSPRVWECPEEVLKEYPVVSFNLITLSPVLRPFIDYWVVRDQIEGAQFREQDIQSAHLAKNAKRFLPKFQKCWVEEFKDEPGIEWFKTTNRGRGWFKNGWGYTLRTCGNSATVAISLAYLLGATEIVLVGVDFVGKVNVIGEEYSYSYSQFIPAFHQFLEDFKDFPIFKTCAESPIDLPLKRFEELMPCQNPLHKLPAYPLG